MTWNLKASLPTEHLRPSLFKIVPNLYPGAGWQNLAAFRREQKWQGNFRQARIYKFRVKCVVLARKRKFAKVTQ